MCVCVGQWVIVVCVWESVGDCSVCVGQWVIVVCVCVGRWVIVMCVCGSVGDCGGGGGRSVHVGILDAWEYSLCNCVITVKTNINPVCHFRGTRTLQS